MDRGGQAFHLTGASPEGKAGAKGAAAILGYVNVNTASTSATVNVYNGTSSNGSLVAAIDASSSTGRAFEYRINCVNGCYAVLTPAATGADVTVTVF